MPQSKFIFYKEKEDITSTTQGTLPKHKISVVQNKRDVTGTRYSSPHSLWRNDEKPKTTAGTAASEMNKGQETKHPLPLFSANVKDFSSMLDNLLATYSINMVIFFLCKDLPFKC